MSLDLSLSADRVIETFGAAAEENRLSSLREHQVVNLPEEGELWVVGDLHDHRRNFDKIVRNAELGERPGRHLVLQEVIHGDRYDANGAESSWYMLYQAAELKLDFPNQVHFLLANHDLAQIHGEGIMKGGLSVCEAFTAGVREQFASDTHKVEFAIKDFLLSFPLAVRTQTGILCCHSLPTDAQIEAFDYTVFNRELTGKDYARRTGPVYQLIWGRNVTPAGAARFAGAMGVEVIVNGHQPQENGYRINGPQHLIIASDHNQGTFLPMSLGERYTMETLSARISRIAGLE